MKDFFSKYDQIGSFNFLCSVSIIACKKHFKKGLPLKHDSYKEH